MLIKEGGFRSESDCYRPVAVLTAVFCVFFMQYCCIETPQSTPKYPSQKFLCKQYFGTLLWCFFQYGKLLNNNIVSQVLFLLQPLLMAYTPALRHSLPKMISKTIVRPSSLYFSSVLLPCCRVCQCTQINAQMRHNETQRKNNYSLHPVACNAIRHFANKVSINFLPLYLIGMDFDFIYISISYCLIILYLNLL